MLYERKRLGYERYQSSLVYETLMGWINIYKRKCCIVYVNKLAGLLLKLNKALTV